MPAAYQHRLLFWGILGAVVFRAVFIGVGVAALEAAHWLIYLLGVLLIATGIRLLRSRGHAVDPEKNPVLRVFRRMVPMTDDYRGAAFVVREGGRRLATPMVAVLVTIETTDVMFALDSIPAVFAVTTDPFIVYSSNLFAILGLRALYFVLAGLLDRFIYLKIGLAALLVFAGAKILVGSVYEVPIALSLAIIVLILGTAIAASLVATHPNRGALVAPLARIAAGIALGTGGPGTRGACGGRARRGLLAAVHRRGHDRGRSGCDRLRWCPGPATRRGAGSVQRGDQDRLGGAPGDGARSGSSRWPRPCGTTAGHGSCSTSPCWRWSHRGSCWGSRCSGTCARAPRHSAAGQRSERPRC